MGLPKKGGLGQFPNLREGLARKSGVLFLRGWYPNAHYNCAVTSEDNIYVYICMYIHYRNILYIYLYNIIYNGYTYISGDNTDQNGGSYPILGA